MLTWNYLHHEHLNRIVNKDLNVAGVFQAEILTLPTHTPSLLYPKIYGSMFFKV
jgi:hypothetical protein